MIGLGSLRFVPVFFDWTVLNSTGSQRLPVRRDRVVNKELDPDGREPRGGWAASAIFGSFVGEEELGAVDGESSDDVSAVQVP